MLITTTSCKKARETVTYKAENGVSQTSSLCGRRKKGRGGVPLPISLPPNPPTAFRRYKIQDLWQLRPLDSFIVIIVINLL